MKYFNKKNTQNKENTKLPMGKKSKRLWLRMRQ